MTDFNEKVEKLKKVNDDSRTQVIQLEQQLKTANEELEETLEELKRLDIKKEDLDSTFETLQKELETTITKLNEQVGIS